PDVVPPQDGEHALRTVRVPAAVERERDDVLSRLQPHDLAPEDRRRQREHHVSPGNRRPGTRARSAGTGSPSGLATTSTAPEPSTTSESTSNCNASASANALCACSPPNGTSSSSDALPARTSP